MVVYNMATCAKMRHIVSHCLRTGSKDGQKERSKP